MPMLCWRTCERPSQRPRVHHRTGLGGADEVVVKTIEAKTGLATTHHVRARRRRRQRVPPLGRVHEELVALAGTPPFTIKLGENDRSRR